MSKMPAISHFFKKQLYTYNKLVIEKWVKRPHISVNEKILAKFRSKKKHLLNLTMLNHFLRFQKDFLMLQLFRYRITIAICINCFD